MAFLKKNKFIIIVICIAALILLTSFYSIARLLFPESGNPVYGNRLDNINKVTIKHDRQIDIANNLKKNNNVNGASIDIRGTLINIIIDVKEKVDVNTAKNLGTKTLTEFTADELGFYDIQVFLTQETAKEDSLYPLIGYKHKLSPALVWSGKQ